MWRYVKNVNQTFQKHANKTIFTHLNKKEFERFLRKKFPGGKKWNLLMKLGNLSALTVRLALPMWPTKLG